MAAQINTTITDSASHQTASPLADNSFGLRRAAYSVNETLELLSLSRATVYGLVRDGRLKAHKIGGKTVFLAPDITRFLLELQRWGGA